jgi:hypothetical protein
MHMLNDVVFHGWPREWIDSPPRFEDLGVLPAGGTDESSPGYQMHKLRYEIVPGFEATAILYEPQAVHGKMPAILNVNGHDRAGKAAEYKQKRCINFGKRGILALSLEWIGFGELDQPQNAHDFGAHLDLVGSSGLGLFYLAMRRGLDYLASRSDVDPKRLGVTGLSGGGWQTIVLGALDSRVAVAVEVAGFGSLESNIARPRDTDEVEEDATDLVSGEDYTFFPAMRAPRPTLLIHNAEDNCCFRAALVKPDIYDAVVPYFRLYTRESAFRWHENTDPATHNYQLDNRMAAYQFFARSFDMPPPEAEIPCSSEIKSRKELSVGLPNDNLTILGLARKLASQIKRDPLPAGDGADGTWAADQRKKLSSVLRYHPLEVGMAWRLANTKSMGLETVSYRLDFNDGLSATAVWLKAIESPHNAPLTIVLDDQGRAESGNEVSERINRGDQVIALDLLFTGDAAPREPGSATYALKIAAVGERPLGIEAGELIAATKWLRTALGVRQIRVESTGIRNSLIALTASAMEPGLFSEGEFRKAMRSLGYLLGEPVNFRQAPDLFCLDLYQDFDIDRLALMSRPARLTFDYIEERKRAEQP